MVDAGVFAPVLTFQKLFEDEGVPITSEEVRAPMGVHKRVLKMPVKNSKLISFSLLVFSRFTFKRSLKHQQWLPDGSRRKERNLLMQMLKESIPNL